jgi:hypothetical protein
VLTASDLSDLSVSTPQAQSPRSSTKPTTVAIAGHIAASVIKKHRTYQSITAEALEPVLGSCYAEVVVSAESDALVVCNTI